jgi:hypothetical protein
MVGYNAGYANTTGVNNAYLGYSAGSSCTGTFNTYLGAEAGYYSSTGSNNVYIGVGSGRGGTGSNNVFIGEFSGYSETANDKLIISNNYSGSDNLNNALVYGDFAAKTFKVNGDFSSVDLLASNDNAAILGQHNVTGYYGVGVKGVGGYIGVLGESTYAGTNSRFGVYGNASGGTTNYGVFGSASGGTAWAGYFSGNVTISNTLTVNTTLYTSDKNLKKNISLLTGALKKVLSLQGVIYEWKSEEELASANLRKEEGIKAGDMRTFNLPKGNQLGVIAQDVEKVLPELVHTDADGLKSVDYVKIIPLLIEAIKDQQKQIEDLKVLVTGLVPTQVKK